MFLLIGLGRLVHGNRGYFNTSHVSINLSHHAYVGVGIGISIHLMFLLIRQGVHLNIRISSISIHLMFLLICCLPIQPLFLFHISIHLMFLLIAVLAASDVGFKNFNTSHVSINHYGGRK